MTARRAKFWACLVLLLVIPLLASGAADQEAELKQVRARIESIRRAIHADAERRDALATQLKNADLQIQSARERLSAVRARRQSLEKELQSLRSEQDAARKEVDAERTALAAEVTAAYMNGEQEQLKLLLNQQDPAQLGRLMTYYRYFGQARAERIGRIVERLAHLDLLQERVARQTDEVRELEVEAQSHVNALAEARKRRAQTLAEIRSKLKTRNQQLAKLQSEARSLERLLEELRRAIDEFPELAEQPFQKTRGKLPWPIRGPLLARFGSARGGGPIKWQGIVIGAARGTQVRSPYFGRVVYADWLPGLGLLLVLDHGNGYMSLYGNNEQLFRRVGDRVRPGDVLGAIGDAAGLGKSGLYLEIRKGKQPLDPLSWLTKGSGR